MDTIVVLDYSLNVVYYYDIPRDADAYDFLYSQGHHPENCSWMVSSNITICDERE